MLRHDDYPRRQLALDIELHEAQVPNGNIQNDAGVLGDQDPAVGQDETCVGPVDDATNDLVWAKPSPYWIIRSDHARRVRRRDGVREVEMAAFGLRVPIK